MHSFYNFHFLDTVSLQLQEKLEALTVTGLTLESLAILEAFQTENSAPQGVYLIHYNGTPVYVGKSGNVAQRLRQHLRKLNGRKNIDAEKIGYKALILDESMSTAANEDVLVKLFKAEHPDMWNGMGFGPKDPGKERDTTKPSDFDKSYPIRDDFPVLNVDEQETVGSLLVKMKSSLPFVFRFKLNENSRLKQRQRALILNLQEVPHQARFLMQAIVDALGPGWKAVILSFGIVLYKTNKDYPYGEVLVARPQ